MEPAKYHGRDLDCTSSGCAVAAEQTVRVKVVSKSNTPSYLLRVRIMLAQ
jgi:hypothetical protein